MAQIESIGYAPDQELVNRSIGAELARFIESDDNRLLLSSFDLREHDYDNYILGVFGVESVEDLPKITKCPTDLRRVKVYWNTHLYRDDTNGSEHVIVQRNNAEGLVTYSAIKVDMTEEKLLEKISPEKKPQNSEAHNKHEAILTILRDFEANPEGREDIIELANGNRGSNNILFNELLAQAANYFDVDLHDRRELHDYDIDHSVSVFDLGLVEKSDHRLIGYTDNNNGDWSIRLESEDLTSLTTNDEDTTDAITDTGIDKSEPFINWGRPTV